MSRPMEKEEFPEVNSPSMNTRVLPGMLRKGEK